MEIDLVEENKEIVRRYRGLLRVCNRSKSRADRNKIRKAFDVALEAHKDMRRKSGEPYIYHPLAVAKIAAEELGLGTLAIVCALLHDTVEDTYITLDDIENLFGKKERIIIVLEMLGVFTQCMILHMDKATQLKILHTLYVPWNLYLTERCMIGVLSN